MWYLQWKPEFDLGDVLTFFGLIATTIGLGFTAWQLRSATLVQRAQFLLETTERYFADESVRKLYYDIDYNKFELRFVNGQPTDVRRGSQEFKQFFLSDEERLLDSLLYTFDVIARVAELKTMKESEARLFAFQAARVFKNKHVAAYLEWLDNERRKYGGDVPSHRLPASSLPRFSEPSARGRVA